VKLTPGNDERRIKTLEAIHNDAVDAIITIDEKATISSVNPATEVMFEYTAKEMIGENIKMLMPNPYRDAHDGYMSNYLETGERKIIGIGREVVGKKSDGTTFPIHLAVSEIKVGDERMFAGVIRNLSDFKQMEEQKTSLGRIVEDSLNEVFVFDAETFLFDQINRGARENLGYTLEELQKMTPINIKPKFTTESFRELVKPLVDGSVNKLEFETIHQRKDGSTYNVEIHLQKNIYIDRPVFVAIILDITRRKEAELKIETQRQQMQKNLEHLVETRTAELRDAQAELVRNERFATLGKVSGGIAHEIRNPLNAVKTSAYFLLNAKNIDEFKIREHLERIDRQVSMIDNVVTALADVAKLPEAKLQPLDLTKVLRGAVNSVGLPSNIKLVYEFEDEIYKVLVDENQILIAFKNLIRNARDAMPDGGTITLTAETKEKTIAFQVADTGIGIAPDHMKRILEPLFTTKARGMGLGLSITSAIVDKNQGSLHVESELGKGSRFTIELKRE